MTAVTVPASERAAASAAAAASETPPARGVTASEPAAQVAGSFDLAAPWRLHPRVALRPESFGALAYHFGNRRLSFIKSRRLLAVVETLGEHPDALAACRAAGVAEAELPRYRRALAALAAGEMIVPREERVEFLAPGEGNSTR